MVDTNWSNTQLSKIQVPKTTKFDKCENPYWSQILQIHMSQIQLPNMGSIKWWMVGTCWSICWAAVLAPPACHNQPTQSCLDCIFHIFLYSIYIYIFLDCIFIYFCISIFNINFYFSWHQRATTSQLSLDCIFHSLILYILLYFLANHFWITLCCVGICVRGNKLVLQEGEGGAFCGNNLGNRWSCLFARKQEVSRRQDRAIARKIIVGHHLSLCLCHKYTSLEQQWNKNTTLNPMQTKSKQIKTN